MSYDKAQWRCLLLPAGDVLADGWTPLRVEHEALYTSSDGNRFFNWDDAAGDGARELAMKFISRFAELARAAEGPDWLYAGWFSNVLGAAENGGLPIFYNGLEDGLPDCTINPPPPPEQPAIDRSSTGVPIILNDDLRHEDLPAIDAAYEDQLNFCGSFDGYTCAVRIGMDLLKAADAAERKGLGNCTMTQLRLVAFARQRQEKWHDWAPAPDWIFRSISDVIEEVRKRLRA
ncbi:hypothetical protein [Rhizorhabdus argentea]|uniref:hypothetical protein n=1 Tax=Rhizorhabdus argentea TaxID=1387174 RepID=UPI0030EDA852